MIEEYKNQFIQAEIQNWEDSIKPANPNLEDLEHRVRHLEDALNELIRRTISHAANSHTIVIDSDQKYYNHAYLR